MYEPRPTPSATKEPPVAAVGGGGDGEDEEDSKMPAVATLQDIVMQDADEQGMLDEIPFDGRWKHPDLQHLCLFLALTLNRMRIAWNN